MRILLVVNGSASSVTARRQVIVQMVLARHHDVDVAETNRRGHATKLALDAAHRGVDVVAVLGGDGTLNEVANGIVGTDCALAPLPGGSTNVFARALGLPDDPVDAAVATLDALDAGSIRPVGLGEIEGRYFLFHVGFGWDAALVERVERRAEIKRYAGHPLFIYAGLVTFFGGYDRSRPWFRLRIDDVAPGASGTGDVVDDARFAVVLNLNPYTFVGNRPFNLAPDATLDRPLTAVTVRDMRTVPFLRLLGSALGDGRRLRSSPDVVAYHPDVTALTISPYHPLPYQVDGDHLGDTGEVRITHQPDVMRLVVPLDAG